MINTLGEAIAHERKVVENLREITSTLRVKNESEEQRLNEWAECAEEHEQLISWLTELQERREADRLISVKERLPENDNPVLVYDGVDMFVAWFSDERGWHSSDNMFDINTPIISWKPLPETYKESEGN